MPKPSDNPVQRIRVGVYGASAVLAGHKAGFSFQKTVLNGEPLRLTPIKFQGVGCRTKHSQGIIVTLHARCAEEASHLALTKNSGALGFGLLADSEPKGYAVFTAPAI